MTAIALQDPSRPLILASTSTTRRDLLSASGLAFAVRASEVDEAPIKAEAHLKGLTAGEAALLLAQAKAEAVSRIEPHAFVLGADQILSNGAHWFDKPASMDEAREQLVRQRDQEQVLSTAVVLMQAGSIVWRHLSEPRIRMRAFSDPLLEHVLAMEGDALLGAVGACRVEGPGQLLIASVHGEHAAILGLPMLALLEELRRRALLLS